MDVRRLHHTVEVPETGEAHVRPQFLKPEKSVRSRRIVDTEVIFSEAITSAYKPDFRIEVFAVLLVAGDKTPHL